MHFHAFSFLLHWRFYDVLAIAKHRAHDKSKSHEHNELSYQLHKASPQATCGKDSVWVDRSLNALQPVHVVLAVPCEHSLSCAGGRVVQV